MEKIKSLPKTFTLTLLLFLSLLAFNFYLLPSAARAAGPIPPPGRIPCDATANPEFNSSRPYQASPCGDSGVRAIFCGNTLRITQNVEGGVVRGAPQFLEIDKPMGGKDYAFDLSDAELPILGNTELTLNSQNGSDQLDDATKLNEYLNWYLNGTLDRAENGQTDTGKVVDFSGPVKKLLPSIIQDAQRMGSIANISKDVSVDTETNATIKSGAKEKANHDQIVVCANKQIPLLPSWLTNIFGLGSVGLGKDIPVECYKGDGSQAQGSIYRLGSWAKDSPLQGIENTVKSYLGKILPGNTLGALLGGVLVDRWPKRTPPLPWADAHGKPFATEQDYQKAYNEWRGDLCAFVPNPFSGAKSLLCVGIPGVTNNDYADLYPYIPLSNTADKNAKNEILSVAVHGGANVEIDWGANIDHKYDVLNEPVLFFPHTQETSDLLDSLNKTFTPQKGTASTATDQSVEQNVPPNCNVVNVRTNPGDNLFPEVTPSEVRVHVNQFTVTQVPCHLDGYYTKVNGYPTSICGGQVSVEIAMETKTPYGEAIWNSAVAGASSDFRKIYPKVEANAPVSCIADIPTSTKVTYKATEGVGNGDFKVIGPNGDNTTGNPQLFFPHIGSVYEYFLKGIQTALRPKGFAEQVTSGTQCATVACQPGETGTAPALPTASGSCKLGSNSLKIPDNLKGAIEAAAQSYNVPASLILGVIYAEGSLNPGSQLFNQSFIDSQLKGCSQLPNCSPDADVIKNVVEFYHQYWYGSSGNNGLGTAVNIIDPKRKPNACNLLDGIFALAKDLQSNQNGYGGFAGKSCFGIPLNAGGGGSSSCSWSDTQVETAIKMWETGVQDSCVTRIGSCAAGTGIPFCDVNTNDPDCDTVHSYSHDDSLISHNACIWNVYSNNK